MSLRLKQYILYHSNFDIIWDRLISFNAEIIKMFAAGRQLDVEVHILM